MNTVFVYIDKDTSIVATCYQYLGQVEDFIYFHNKFVYKFRPNYERNVRLKLVSYVDGKYDENQILSGEKEIKDLKKDNDGKTRLFTIVSTAVQTNTTPSTRSENQEPKSISRLSVKEFNQTGISAQSFFPYMETENYTVKYNWLKIFLKTIIMTK
ncbi:hypothetical protein DLAC_02630 [Tieghemostelium lacteum]|uniref:Uncharacterized protein n=1 Tax=Tieghemostelium lacteum TaxID=361077 RepID=A0A152A3C7_TIELA|nr:hypothetical protein DLAC_02630 [Tieghemostelium lacteum]|eukprot:KYR00607.1 hypothetical protein DLAC_02630 [Tieghemostelium lacteum]